MGRPGAGELAVTGAMARRALAAVLGMSCLLATGGHGQSEAATAKRASEPIVGLPCDGCEAVFVGLPADLVPHSRIAPPGEPGEPLRIEGAVFDREGRPAVGVIVYAYHTDAKGIYPPGETRHGRLRGWSKTDWRGLYRFDTIRPGGYPGRTTPAHIHMHVIEVGCCAYYIDDIVFDDDPRLTPEQRRQMTPGRGGAGVTKPIRDRNNVWVVVRDIRLGEKIPGYPADRP